VGLFYFVPLLMKSIFLLASDNSISCRSRIRFAGLNLRTVRSSSSFFTIPSIQPRANGLSDGFFVRNIRFSTMLLVIQQPDFFPTGCVLSEPNTPLVAVLGVKAVHQFVESNNPGGI
jgi:hypothetical protein